jgi:hypothetical protein
MQFSPEKLTKEKGSYKHWESYELPTQMPEYAKCYHKRNRRMNCGKPLQGKLPCIGPPVTERDIYEKNDDCDSPEAHAVTLSKPFFEKGFLNPCFFSIKFNRRD